jgi:hypothetical protein
VGTSEEGTPGDSWRACRRDVAEGTKVPHDGPAEVPVRLDAGRHKGVARVHMAGMRPVLIPVTQSGSGASRLGGGGNVGRAARMNHEDIQQGGTMGRGKGHLNVSTCPLTANRGNANRSITGFCTRIAARAGGDAAERLLPVVVPTRAAAAEAIAAHGVVQVAALDVTTTQASGGLELVAGTCGLVPVAPRRKWQPLMKPPSERQIYGVTVSFSHHRVRHAQVDSMSSTSAAGSYYITQQIKIKALRQVFRCKPQST